MIIHSAAVEKAVPADRARAGRGFYRPELDALRLFAFLCIFIFHGPRLLTTPVMDSAQIQIARWYNVFASGFAYSLCLFFFLSAYLITEILLREQTKTGTVHLKAFYMRRVLRIWPLYFFGIGLALCISIIDRNHYHVPPMQFVFMLLFVGWLVRDFSHNPMGPLWSISVEEVFYLMWPSVMKFGGLRSLAVVTGLAIPAALLAAQWLRAWYNPLPHFVFFATGALLALLLHKRKLQISFGFRALMLAVGLFWWLSLSSSAIPFAHTPDGAFDFACMDLGCLAIFLSFYDLPHEFFPGWILSLGQMTYSLYVFHLVSQFYTFRLLHRLGWNLTEWGAMFGSMAIALVFATIAASLTYRYVEQPFLKLKDRFTFIRSGAVVAPAQASRVAAG